MKSLSAQRRQVPLSGIREIYERSFGDEEVVHLELGTPSFTTPHHIINAALEAAHRGFTHYTPNAGFPSLREALAFKMHRVNQVKVTPENIVVTAGAGLGLTLTFLVLCDEGEEVLIPDPGWPNFHILLQVHGFVPIPYPLRPENGFLPDLEELERLVTPRTKALLVNSPSNPTGAVFPQETLQQLYEFCCRHDLFLVSDEVYEQILFDGRRHISPASFDGEGRVISVYSFSKGYAMTGWRVGYVVAPREIAQHIAHLQEPFVSCAPALAQKAAEEAVNGPQEAVESMVLAYLQRRDIALALLEPYGCVPCPPQGAFYLWVDVSNLPFEDSRALALALLEKEKVAVAPGVAFGQQGKHWIRLSLAANEKDVVKGIECLSRYFEG